MPFDPQSGSTIGPPLDHLTYYRYWAFTPPAGVTIGRRNGSYLDAASQFVSCHRRRGQPARCVPRLEGKGAGAMRRARLCVNGRIARRQEGEMIRTYVIYTVVPLAALVAACGGAGNANAPIAAGHLSPGQATTVTVNVTANTAGTEALSSCDSVQVTGVRNDSTGTSEPLGMDLSAAVVGSLSKSGAECSVAMTITAAADAIPDYYEVDLQFNYTLVDSLDGSVRTDDSTSAIDINVSSS